MSVTSKIRKQGGAAVITVPPTLLKLMNIGIGAQVALSVEHGALVAQPVATARKRYLMADLVKGSAAMKKFNAEVAWAREGDPIGHEIV